MNYKANSWPPLNIIDNTTDNPGDNISTMGFPVSTDVYKAIGLLATLYANNLETKHEELSKKEEKMQTRYDITIQLEDDELYLYNYSFHYDENNFYFESDDKNDIKIVPIIRVVFIELSKTKKTKDGLFDD